MNGNKQHKRSVVERIRERNAELEKKNRKLRHKAFMNVIDKKILLRLTKENRELKELLK